MEPTDEGKHEFLGDVELNVCHQELPPLPLLLVLPVGWGRVKGIGPCRVFMKSLQSDYSKDNWDEDYQGLLERRTRTSRLTVCLFLSSSSTLNTISSIRHPQWLCEPSEGVELWILVNRTT